MKYVATVTCAFLFLATVPPAHGQETPPSNYKHLKPLDFLIGNWHAQVTAEKDSPAGILKKGDKYDYYLSLQWAVDKNAITENFTIKEGAKVVFHWQRLIGWHAGKKQIVSGKFTSIGGSGMSTWKRKGDNWAQSSKSVNGTGKEGSSTIILSNIRQDSFVTQVIHRTRDGKKEPDGPRVAWKRGR